MLRPRFCLCILCPLIGLALALLFLLTQGAGDANAQTQPKKQVSFINDVAPILKENCFACHDSKRRKGKLDMTTFENFRKGGSREDPIEPGKPEESTIIDLITATGSGRMPPKEAGDALPIEKIYTIKLWIKQGAKLDPGIDPKADLYRELRVRWTPPVPPAVYKFPVTVNALTFTPDSKRVIVGGYHELTVWDIDSGKLVQRVRTRAERAYAMTFLPDGKLVVAGGRPGQEGDVRVYDISDKTAGKMVDGVVMLDGVNDRSVLLGHLLDTDDSILTLALSKDGKKLAAAGCDRLVRIWDLSAGATKAKLEQTIENHADWVFALAFSPDGKWLMTASRDKTAKIWDIAAKESLVTFPDHQQPVYGVALSGDGRSGISVGEDNNLRFWQATDQAKNIGKQVKVGSGGHSKGVFKLVVQGEGKDQLAATCSADGTVKLWSLGAGSATKTLSGLTDWVYAVAISPDGKLVAAGAWNGEVRVWKTDGTPVRTFNASPGYVAKVEAPKK
jgi:WD40 repeat protein